MKDKIKILNKMSKTNLISYDELYQASGITSQKFRIAFSELLKNSDIKQIGDKNKTWEYCLINK